MPGKDTYHVGNKFLKNAGFYINLGSDVFAASFKERILIGTCEFDDKDDGYFSKKSIVIPSTVYVNFVQCLQKAMQFFTNDKEGATFEKLLFKYSKVHHVVTQFGSYQDGPPSFKLLIKWNFAKDKAWSKLCEDGKKIQIILPT